MEEKRRNLNDTIVYIQDEEVYGEVLSFGTYVSTVHYLKDGFEYKLLMLNEDFEVVEQINIEEIEEEF